MEIIKATALDRKPGSTKAVSFMGWRLHSVRALDTENPMMPEGRAMGT
jgi:hypothetical protein